MEVWRMVKGRGGKRRWEKRELPTANAENPLAILLQQLVDGQNGEFVLVFNAEEEVHFEMEGRRITNVQPATTFLRAAARVFMDDCTRQIFVTYVQDDPIPIWRRNTGVLHVTVSLLGSFHLAIHVGA